MLNVTEFHLISIATDPNVSFNDIENSANYPQNNPESPYVSWYKVKTLERLHVNISDTSSDSVASVL